MGIVIKSAAEVELMRKAGRALALILERLMREIQPGMTTAELDDITVQEVQRHGVKPSFKGYHGYPANLCVSINDEVVHGIPGERQLQEGDIVSLDFGVIREGLQADAAVTVGVGEISPEAQRLLEATRGSLLAGIEQCRPGAHLGDISAAIQEHVESRGFAVVREYSGHGVGRELHEEPQVPNFGSPGSGPRLRQGMTLALEPMVNAGGWLTRLDSNQWTVLTADGSLSAHFEHTVVITGEGAEVLTDLVR
ncbi:MAG: type I methionyl aminopeptidase [Dehalococcoidia bacterium]